MNQPLPATGDLLAIVQDRSVRLVRLAGPLSRCLVRVPVTPALRVEVTARIIQALVEARPARYVLVAPRDNTTVRQAAVLVSALRAGECTTPVVLLPTLIELLRLADREVGACLSARRRAESTTRDSTPSRL